MKPVSTLAMAVAMTTASTNPAIAQDGLPGPDQDPYIWLEEARSDKALDWVKGENDKTLAALASDPRFEVLKAEALAIYDNTARIPYVSFRGDGLYNFWQDKDHPRGLVRRTTLASYRTAEPAWETVLDIDALAKAEGREWVYQGMTCLPPEGRFCMVALSDGGKDATVLREFDTSSKSFVEGGFTLPESQGGIEWIDKDTLMISRDFGGGTVTESDYPFTTRIWKRGTAIEQAPEIFRGDVKDVWAQAGLLRDNAGTIHGQTAFRGTSFFERDYFVGKGDEWMQLDMPKKASFFGIVDGQLLFSTDVEWKVGDQTFPADALVSVDLEAWKADPNGAPKTLVWAPGHRQTRQGAAISRDSLYVGLLDNVRGQVVRLDHVGGVWALSPLDLPENATIGIRSASESTDEVFFTVTDFLHPSSLHYLDGGTGKIEVLKTAPTNFSAEGMAVEQFSAVSKDGTKIPYFIVKPNGMKMDGSTPTLLSGYGGFQVPQLPNYLGTKGKLWVENGGAYVLANLRGGGEFGPSWHQTAMGENKQRTWDDFIAVAEDLVKRKLTSPDHLGIEGGSQGGLLVGTAFTQRPDLFDAAVVWIPLFDMLRYPVIGRGASWIGEYGDPRIAEQRAWIEPYSPYQKLLEGKDYPSPLFIASTADDRTHPAHARKAVARLHELGQPVLYFEDMTGGHSGGVDNEQRARLQALETVYLMKRLMD